MSDQRRALSTSFRALTRAGSVLCLLLAAIALGVGVGEYPGYTGPALRWHATEVLPLLAIGLINLAALDSARSSDRWTWWVIAAIDLALLVHSLQAVQVGAAPFAFMLAGVAGLLVLGALGMTLVRAGMSSIASQAH